MKKGWEMVKLGEVLKLNLDSVEVSAMSEFPFAGVYSFGNGLFKRGGQSGSDTSYKTFNRLHKNQIVVSKVKGWEGAIAKVEEDYDGLFLSPICPTFDLISEQKADIHFIDWFLKQEFVWQKLLDGSKGIGARRNSISEKQFLNLEIPLPPLSEQQRIAGRLAALKGKIDAVRALRGEQEKEMKGLLLMQYQKIIAGAEWKPMKEVAPLMRRKVDLQPNTVYSEIGVRSFGKGIFEKPSFNSDELSWEKPNWIAEGDLLMSNIKAWEGAVAAVGKEHNGKVGSHRYLTFVPHPEISSAKFLAFYFLTETGNLKLSEASPGSADRNRTLNTKIILNTLVPVPDLELQKEFLQLQTKMDALKAAQAGQLSALEGVFPGVLEKAFRGEW